MKHIYKILITLITYVFLGNQSVYAQSNWNNIYYAPSAPNQGYIYSVKRSISVDGKLYMYGDTMGSFMQSPYVTVLDPQNNNGIALSMSTYSLDNKATSAAAISTPTPGTSYVYFGTTGSSPHYPGIYKLNTQTNVVTRDSLANGMANYHNGIDNMIFFNNSASANHDTLNIFANYFGSINVYRKYHTQIGASTSQANIPFQNIYKSMIYNDTLYVFGYSNLVNSPRLYKSPDGLNYSECIGFSNAQMALGGSASYGFDLDTLNNSLYVLLGDNESFTRILKTDDGSTFNETQASGYFKRYVSLKNYRNKMWLCGKSMSFSPNGNNLIVSYLSPSGQDITSIDTLGMAINNNGADYHLNVLNDSLYCSGRFDYTSGMPARSASSLSMDYYGGISVFKLTPPVAGMIYDNNLACLNTSLTFTSTSTNADSTSWLYDGVFVAMSPGQSAWYSFNNNTTGNHVVSLVAYGAGITDTISISIDVYEVLASVAGSTLACNNVPLDLIASELGGYAPINYQWHQSGVAIGADTTALAITPAPGTYAYNAVITDVHGCVGYSDTLIVQVNPSKNIFGLVTTGTLTPLPVAGKVILYKYEPFLTQFDSVDFKTIDAAGGYTFTSFTAGDYIIKAIPDASTLQITYGTSFVSWQDATTIQHGCEFDENKDIDVKEFTNIGLGTGTGFMSGRITMADGFGEKSGGAFKPTAPGNPIGGIVVKGGRNPGGQMFTQTTTDSDGKYTLPGLPDNILGNEHYFIQVDIPGLDTNQTYHRHLISGNNQFPNLDFTVDSMHVNPINYNNVSVNDLNVEEHQLSVFPNPTSNQININYSLKDNSSVSIELFDMVGRAVKTLLPLTTQPANKYNNTFQLADLNSGMYFIKLKINEKESVVKICLNN